MTGMTRPIFFRFQLSGWTLFSIQRQLQVRAFGIGDTAPSLDELPPLEADCAGMMLRSLPFAANTAGISRLRLAGQELMAYVLSSFPRYYIDMGQSFEDYKTKFSSKTRSTLNRKIKKFGDLAGGQIRWERFSSAEELERFWQLARQVSAKTYQERLLGSGLPDDSAYFERARRLAEVDNLRAFLLFDGERPVSYLFCPAHAGVLEYAYLGYDPEYLHLSVGTVLQWLALESLFAEQRFRFFDFTEGESEHKRLFATHHLRCANLALLRPTLTNRLLAHGHWRFGRCVEALGAWLQRRDLKTKVRRWLRFGHIKG